MKWKEIKTEYNHILLELKNKSPYELLGVEEMFISFSVYQSPQFVKVDSIVIFTLFFFGGFNNLGDIDQSLIVHNRFKCLKADKSLPDVFMPINSGTQLFLRII